MKFLTKLLLVFIAILGLFFAYISTKPDKYDVKRTQIINAPINTVFNTVNDYNTWKKWGPWMDKDSTLVMKVAKKSSGIGASYSWNSEKGEGGKMETISLENNKSINQKIYFGNKGSSDVYWFFNEVPKGTKVTWGIKSDLSLLEKAGFFVVGGAELMFGPMTAKGLKNLDEFIKQTKTVKKSDKYSFTDRGVGEYGGQYYVGLKATCSFDELGATLDRILPDVLIYCMKKGIKKDGALFNIYHKYDDKNKIVTVSSCVPVSKKVAVDKKYDVAVLEKSKYHKTTFQGNYSHSDEAWMKAFEFVAKKELVIDESKKPYEVYVKGHTQSPNPEDWITEIYIPIK